MTNPGAGKGSGEGRVGEIDALRGIAAVTVMLFHYTTRFGQLYGFDESPLFSVPWGHYGVNLFFLISGYVIYMTLGRTRRLADFVVSRFSRLYPAFWAAVAITFCTVLLLGLPGKEVSPGNALLNLLMFHGLFRVPHVDSVYWTLEVELLFYALVMLLFRFRLLARIHWFIVLLLALRVGYDLFARVLNIDLPWIVGHLLIIQYLPWFAIGIMIYRRVTHSASSLSDMWVIALSLAVLFIFDSATVGALTVLFSMLLYLAASGRLSLLRWGLLVWLGDISYTLYLLHENIGWAILLRFKAAGLGANLAIPLVIAISLCAAGLLTRYLERPAMRWIRGRYRTLASAAA